MYGRVAPLEVDLGCGDGSFLVAIADKNPEHDFLGIERLVGRVRSACQRIERARLKNARVLRVEISYVVEQLLPPNSVTAFHLMFPDPWPKRRHAPRRLVSENFMASMHRALTEDGKVRISTDDSAYFHQIKRLVSQTPLYVVDSASHPSFAVSKFEKRFADDGVPIHRLELRKVSPGT
ncbi:MAG: tRNA (guanosine(46)-N7)-methyltransferase TrmB [Chthoniobacterales bacterium]